MHYTRRATIQLAAALATCGMIPYPPARANDMPFGFDAVIEKAQIRATRSYDVPDRSLPDALGQMSYDEYRRISFRREKTLLRDGGSDFGLQLFHRGGIFRKRVDVNLITKGVVTPLTYSPDLFDFGAKGPPAGLLSGLGFSGIRLLYPLNTQGKLDELVTFLGASYFRFLGKGQRYDLSARGLSIGSGSANEEFPDFVEYWVSVPDAGQNRIMIYALLDSLSLTGAFRFVFTPGAADEVDVKAALFARRDLVDLGIAPLTSMFFYGENTVAKPRDFRPEVHDSDGLAIHTGSGEWIWRPLRNPARTATSAFEDLDNKGFGLLQRDRRFRSYQDLEARYNLRPSYWVEMKAATGKGQVSLTELHAGRESEDNIVACWIPADQPAAGSRTDLSYTIRSSSTPLHSGGRVVSTFETKAAASVSEGKSGFRRLLIDFNGGRLGSANLMFSKVELIISTSGGTISRPIVIRNREIAGVRAAFDIELPPEDVDLRAFLRAGNDTLTETWSYRIDAAP